MAIGQAETSLFVIGLLSCYAIKANRTARKTLKAGVPDLNTVAFATKLWLDNIKPNKAKRFAVLNGRDRGNRLITKQAN